MTIKIPWIKVGLLIGKLVKAAKGGIDKEEAQDLLSDLAEIAAHIALQLANK
jgi:hypothetical protein